MPDTFKVKKGCGLFKRALLTFALSHGSLAIGTTATKVKTVTTTINYLINGQFYSKAPTDDLWTLTGFNCANGKFCRAILLLDSSGNASIAVSNQAATIEGCSNPPIPDNKCVVGTVTVNPTGTGNFTGGTTALNDGTVVPNAVYTNATVVIAKEWKT
jgi:hypothetical protein